MKQSHLCDLDGCSKAYSNLSSLIQHEKDAHSFYRREKKAYDKLPANELDVNELVKNNESEIDDTSGEDLEHRIHALTLADLLPAHTLDGPDVFRFSDVL